MACHHGGGEVLLIRVDQGVMKLTYDPAHNIAYLRLHDRQLAGGRITTKINVDEYDHLYYQVDYHGKVVCPGVPAVC